jgi:SAM-dependent methyltransferase
MTDSETALSEDPALAALVALHDGLAHLGPALESATLAALDRVRGRLPERPRVVDLGCGTGASTLLLAEALPAATVTGIDLFPPFVETLDARAAARGLRDRVAGRVGDMADLPDLDGAVDLLWSEGAAYQLTFAGALAAWRPLLAPGGVMVLSECSWLVETPPPEAAAHWAAAYPAMGTVATNVDRAQAAGFDVLFTDVLPAEGWTESYYGPLAARIAEIGAAGPVDDAMAAAIAETEREIALYRRCGDSYGYVFYGLAAHHRDGA